MPPRATFDYTDGAAEFSLARAREGAGYLEFHPSILRDISEWFQLLPEVAREVGKDLEIVRDTGIMNGVDVVASIALGAR